MMFELLTDSLFLAIWHSNWLYSRKYRTVWYHPASSRFYLTVLILCKFQEKLTGTLPDSDARATCVKTANPACCVLGVRCWFYVNNSAINRLRREKRVVKRTCRWSEELNSINGLESQPIGRWSTRGSTDAEKEGSNTLEGKHEGGRSIHDWQRVKESVFREFWLLGESFSIFSSFCLSLDTISSVIIG
jgi:hypothetical protein